MTGTKSFTRIAADTAGGSNFHDDEIRHDISGASHPAPHNAPRRQWVVMLRGIIEVEVTDGSRRTFGPGDLIRAEDTDGTGHVTRLVGDPPWEALYLPG